MPRLACFTWVTGHAGRAATRKFGCAPFLTIMSQKNCSFYSIFLCFCTNLRHFTPFLKIPYFGEKLVYRLIFGIPTMVAALHAGWHIGVCGTLRFGTPVAHPRHHVHAEELLEARHPRQERSQGEHREDRDSETRSLIKCCSRASFPAPLRDIIVFHRETLKEDNLRLEVCVAKEFEFLHTILL